MKKLLIVLVCILGVTGMAQEDPDNPLETVERTPALKALYQKAKYLENNGSAEDINANRLAIKDEWQKVDPEIAALYKPLPTVEVEHGLTQREISSQQSQSIPESPEDWSDDLLLRNNFIDGVDMDVTGEGHIYIAGYENNGGGSSSADIFIYRSTDHGNNFELWKEIIAMDNDVLKLETIVMDGTGTDYLLIYVLTDDGVFQVGRWNISSGDYDFQAIVSDVSDFSLDRNYPENTDGQSVFGTYHKEDSGCSEGGALFSARSTAGSYGFDWIDESSLTDCVSQPSFAYGRSGLCYVVFIRNGNLVNKTNSDYNDPAAWGSNYLVGSGSDFEFRNPSIIATRDDGTTQKAIILNSQRHAGTSDDFFLETYLKDSNSNSFSSDERYATGFGDIVHPDGWIRKENDSEIIRMSYIFTDDRPNFNNQNDLLSFDGTSFTNPERIARDVDVWAHFPSAIAETSDGFPCAAFAGTNSDGTRGYGLYFNAKSDLMNVEDTPIDGFTFYPNPAQNSLHLSAKNTISNVAIYSLLGQQVMEISPEQKNHAIDVSSLARGVYVMKVEVEGQKSSYKIIKD